MITSKDIILEAETWIGTPWKHQGRIKHVGVDCYGLILEVSKFFELDKLVGFKSPTYGRQPNAKMMFDFLRTYMIEVPTYDLKNGTVLFMAYGSQPMHLAFYDSGNIIHAFILAKKCIKQRFDSNLKAKVRGAFQFHGVQY